MSKVIIIILLAVIALIAAIILIGILYLAIQEINFNRRLHKYLSELRRIKKETPTKGGRK